MEENLSMSSRVEIHAMVSARFHLPHRDCYGRAQAVACAFVFGKKINENSL